MVDLIAFAVLALAAFYGWRRGVLLMGLTLGGLVGSYLGAFLFARPVGELLSRSAHLPPLVAVPLAGLLVFMLISTVLKIATFRAQHRRAEARAAGEPPSAFDNAGGAVLGAVGGAAVVLLIAWAMIGLRMLVPGLPRVDRSLTGRVAAAAMERAVYAVARGTARDPFVASLISRVLANPQRGAGAIGSVLGDARVQRLWTDPALRAALIRGDAAALGNASAVRALAEDPALGAAAADLGLLDRSAAGGDVAGQLVERLGPLARSFEALKTDPEVRRLLEDPDVARSLQSGDVQALVTDPRFSWLASRLAGSLGGTGTSTPPR